jgi:hypothetical protein
MDAGRDDGQLESLAIHRGINDASGWIFGAQSFVCGE